MNLNLNEMKFSIIFRFSLKIIGKWPEVMTINQDSGKMIEFLYQNFPPAIAKDLGYESGLPIFFHFFHFL